MVEQKNSFVATLQVGPGHQYFLVEFAANSVLVVPLNASDIFKHLSLALVSMQKD